MREQLQNLHRGVVLISGGKLNGDRMFLVAAGTPGELHQALRSVLLDEVARVLDRDVRLVDGAGHSIQGDKPLEMAGLIEDLLAR